MYDMIPVDKQIVEENTAKDLNRHQRKRIAAKVKKFVSSMEKEIDILRLSKKPISVTAVQFYDQIRGLQGDEVVSVFLQNKSFLSLIK